MGLYTGDFVELLSAPEAAYGTEGTWDRRLRFKKAKPVFKFEHATDEGQFNGAMGDTSVLAADVRQSAMLNLEGNYNANHSFLLLRFMGDTTDSELETSAYQHVLESVTLTNGDFDIDSSLSFQLNEGPTVPAILGCKVGSVEISGNSQSNDISVIYKIFGQKANNDDTTFDVGALTYNSIKDFYWKDFTVAIGDDSLNAKVNSFKLLMDTGMEHEWASSGSKYGVELQPKKLEVIGEFTAWYDAAYLKTTELAGTLIDVTYTFEGETLLGATKYPKSTIAITKAMITEAPVVELEAGSKALISFKFKAFADPDNSNKIVTITNQDGTATLTKHS